VSTPGELFDRAHSVLTLSTKTFYEVDLYAEPTILADIQYKLSHQLKNKSREVSNLLSLTTQLNIP